MNFDNPSLIQMQFNDSRKGKPTIRQVELLRGWARQHTVDVADLFRVEAALEAGGLVLPGLEVQPFFDPADFVWSREVRASAVRLTKEFDQIEAQLKSHPESDVLLSRGVWWAFFLWRKGYERSEECRLAPTAANVTKLAPGGGQAGNSYFSLLGPGTEIRAHSARFNARLRCHVGLSIPDGAWIDVAGERRGWAVGECLIFCDALSHQVANDGIDARTVFAFDFWHPSVTVTERAALSMLLTSRQ